MIIGKKLKIFLIMLAAGCVFSAAGVIVFFSRSPEIKFSQKNELRKIIFDTNGKITSKWLVEALALKKGTDLFALDILSMEKFLGNIPQIKKIFLEKRYPDSLFIKIEERAPILKIAVNENGTKKLFLIEGQDGTIFSPICYGGKDIADLLAANLELKTGGKGKFPFLPMKGVEIIRELVTLLKDDFSDIFHSVHFIDLRNYDNRSGAVWATVELHLKNDIIVMLAAKNFDLQLLKLGYLLNEKCANNLHRIRKINISSLNDAVIEYK